MCVCVFFFFFFFFFFFSSPGILCHQKFRPTKFQSLYAGAGVLNVSILHHLRLTPSCHLRFDCCREPCWVAGALESRGCCSAYAFAPTFVPQSRQASAALGGQRPWEPQPGEQDNPVFRIRHRRIQAGRDSNEGATHCITTLRQQQCLQHARKLPPRFAIPAG